MSAISRNTIHPARCGGRPCIRDLCVRVADVLDLLDSGASRHAILADYAYLENEDITAALELAARHPERPILRSRTGSRWGRPR